MLTLLALYCCRERWALDPFFHLVVDNGRFCPSVPNDSKGWTVSGDAGIVMASKLGAGDFGLSGVWSISLPCEHPDLL